MREFLSTLVSIALAVASLFGVPFWLAFAYLGFSGQLADADQASNTQAGVVYLLIAVAIALATTVWFRFVFSRP